jgi:hypothetical protein
MSYARTVMPDIKNIEEESLEDFKSDRQEDVNEDTSQKQTIEPTQSRITNSKLQTEEMEVHKHPHDVMHKKNWKEYMLEFFMIFFAVTLGFFAEGYREYLGDRHKESENMQGLLKDVRNDSVILQANLIEIINQNKGLDSLIAALRKPLSDKQNLERVYVLYLKYGEVYSHVFFSEGSILQMINSGGLRIVRNSDMVKLINQYENIKLLVRKDEDDLRKLEGEIERGQANQIFDFTSSSKIDRFIDTAESDVSIDVLMKLADESKIDLINNNPLLIASFRNNLKSYKAFNEDYLYWVKGTVIINQNMIAKIKDEYFDE